LDADLDLSGLGHDPVAGTLAGCLRVPAAHPILRGHFPGAPLVPGVLLLEAVRRACERLRGRRFVIAAVDEVRFLRPVAPDAVVAFTAQAATDGDALAVAGEWRDATGRIATFQLRLEPCGA
jgi:3-hydroxyacyl-[acyl-carrier-protein] dehydratase